MTKNPKEKLLEPVKEGLDAAKETVSESKKKIEKTLRDGAEAIKKEAKEDLKIIRDAVIEGTEKTFSTEKKSGLGPTIETEDDPIECPNCGKKSYYEARAPCGKPLGKLCTECGYNPDIDRKVQETVTEKDPAPEEPKMKSVAEIMAETSKGIDEGMKKVFKPKEE